MEAVFLVWRVGQGLGMLLPVEQHLSRMNMPLGGPACQVQWAR